MKKGQVETYQIQKYGQNVAQDNFMFGDDKQIVSSVMFCLEISASNLPVS